MTKSSLVPSSRPSSPKKVSVNRESSEIIKSKLLILIVYVFVLSSFNVLKKKEHLLSNRLNSFFKLKNDGNIKIQRRLKY